MTKLLINYLHKTKAVQLDDEEKEKRWAINIDTFEFRVNNSRIEQQRLRLLLFGNLVELWS